MRSIQFPRRGEKYTFAQIRKLPLRDNPFLCVNLNGDWVPIQSHPARHPIWNTDRHTPVTLSPTGY